MEKQTPKESVALMADSRNHTTMPVSSQRNPLINKLSLFLGLMWLAPITALLTLNFTNHVVGASFGCARGGRCVVSPVLSNLTDTALHLDRSDHNAPWCATTASKSIRNLVRHCHGFFRLGFVEYADPKALFAPSFWTSASARADAKGP
jgi:hypothetical protein